MGWPSGLLRQRSLLWESLLVGRLLSRISTWVSSALLPATAAAETATSGLAPPASRHKATLSSTGRKTTRKCEADAAARETGRKASRTTDRWKTARDCEADAAAGESGRAIDSAGQTWRTIHFTGKTRSAVDTAGETRRTDDTACATGCATATNDPSGNTTEYAGIARLSSNYTQCQASNETECVFRFSGGKAGECARQPQLKPAAQTAKRTSEGTERTGQSAKRRQNEAIT